MQYFWGFKYIDETCFYIILLCLKFQSKFYVNKSNEANGTVGDFYKLLI